MGLVKIEEAINTWIVTDDKFQEGMVAFHSLPRQEQMMIVNMAIRLAKDKAQQPNVIPLHKNA